MFRKTGSSLRRMLVPGFFLQALFINHAALANPVNYCVYDPLGTQGDSYALARDYQLAAKRWGVDLQLKAYNSETVAVEDFKVGQCDMVNMTGLRARLFNQFSGTIDAPGAVESYIEMRHVMSLIASPKLANYLVEGQFEVAGVIPLGAGYAFVNNRNINTIGQIAGKKIAVMKWDKTESIMAEQFGAQAIPVDINDMGTSFNNGAVDVLIAPVLLYKPFELYKGLGDNGGIIRRAVLQISMQLIIRRDRFPAGFGQQSREYMATTVDHALGVIRNTENEVDARHWIYMNTRERDDYYRTVRVARARLEKEGFYDRHMLGILKRVRCVSVPDDGECAGGDE